MCPGCGQRDEYGRWQWGLVWTSGRHVRNAIVCQRCAEHATLLVAERDGSELARTEVLAPFVRYLYKLARVYELDDEKRAEGLRQAAGVLEHGHPPRDEVLSSALAASTADATRANGQAPATSTERGRKRSDTIVVSPVAGAHVTLPLGATSTPAALPIASRVASTSTPLETLDGVASSILALLASDPARSWSRTEVAIEAHYAVRSGSFAQGIARLRERLCIEGPASAMRATEHGRSAARLLGLQRKPRGAAMAEFWARRVGTMAGTILQVVSAPNAPATRDELAERTGYGMRSGSFAQALATLRRLGLVVGIAASREYLDAIGE